MAETASASKAKAALAQRFPGLRMQVSSCRKIARSNNWSQHAFDNAIDAFAPTATLDMVAAFLRSNKGPLSVNNVLWRVRDHYDHVHVDFWPQGTGTPACAGGRPTWRSPAGGQVGGELVDVGAGAGGGDNAEAEKVGALAAGFGGGLALSLLGLAALVGIGLVFMFAIKARR